MPDRRLEAIASSFGSGITACEWMFHVEQPRSMSGEFCGCVDQLENCFRFEALSVRSGWRREVVHEEEGLGWEHEADLTA